MGYEWLQVALDALREIEPFEVFQVLSATRRRPVAAQAAGVAILTIWGRTHAGGP
jgi:hypothetical protein